MWDSKSDNEVTMQRQAVNVSALQLEGLVKENIARTLAVAKLKDPKIEIDFERAVNTSTEQAAKLLPHIQSEIKDPHAQSILLKVLESRKTFIDGRDAAFSDLNAGNMQRAEAFFNKEMPKLISDYTSQVEALSAYETKAVDTTLRDSDKAINTGLAVLGAATLLALIFSPWFAWLVTRSITRPLAAAVRLAGTVAKRDLGQDIKPRGRDEITQLELALHEMVLGLHDAVGQVREGADAIASAAGQISAGNIDLSSRTEQQSASLTQTAASMEEITATVRQNSDSAQQAKALAEETATAAANGGEVVSRMVTTMNDISTKSQQIGEIVGVIDSIAFQTNILALNAAVEAARAGEQGRGFAVVASEVRALAQRSAASAKEIRSLIDTAVAAISHGNEEAAQVGVSMQKIVADVGRVTYIVSEIDAASHEQSAGIEQVNVAVTQMDDVTRQNASLVEESAAAAASLQEQANTLADLVATFDLGAAGDTEVLSVEVLDGVADRASNQRRQVSGTTPQRAARSLPLRPRAALAGGLSGEASL